MAKQITSSQKASVSASAATIINLDATTNNKNNPVVQFFKAGTYEVSVIGTSKGGQYDAWSLWSVEYGCDEKGENCVTGWVNEYNLTSSEFTINIPSTGKYSTPKQALETAQNTSFTLRSDGQVKFFIADDQLPDNRGGMSLAVKKVSQGEDYPQSRSGSFVLILIVSLSVLVLWILIRLIAGNPGT